jgi:hypothetical protein
MSQNMDVEYVVSSPVAEAPTLPISPRSAANILHQAPNDVHTIMDVAQGLIATVRSREEQFKRDLQAERQRHIRYMDEHRVEAEEMEQENARLVARVEELSPTEKCPEGYEQNRDGRAPQLVIPTEKGGCQPAWWVKRLADGKVAGLPKEYTIDDAPFVQDIYATPVAPNPHDREWEPVLPLPPWVLQLLKGPTAFFNTIIDEVNDKSDWGMWAEVERYRTLEHTRRDQELRLADLQGELQTVRHAQELCAGRLERARLATVVSELRTTPVMGKNNSGQHYQYGRKSMRASKF